MKPLDLARKLRRDAAFEPAALDRGKAELMAAIRQAQPIRQAEPRRRTTTIVPQVPYQDIRAALDFLERAFGFLEIRSTRLEATDGVIHHANVQFGDSVIGIGTQGAHGARSPLSTGIASGYISVYVDDIDAHYERARAAGAQVERGPHGHARDYRVYEALDLEGHRWRFIQWMEAAPPTERR